MRVGVRLLDVVLVTVPDSRVCVALDVAVEERVPSSVDDPVPDMDCRTVRRLAVYDADAECSTVADAPVLEKVAETSLDTVALPDDVGSCDLVRLPELRETLW